MFRKKTPDDISDSDYSMYVKPHFDLMDNHLIDYVIPDFCAFYIFSAYNHHCEQENFKTFIECALTYFSTALSKSNIKTLKIKVVKILKEKYGLSVINDVPLELQSCFPKLL